MGFARYLRHVVSAIGCDYTKRICPPTSFPSFVPRPASARICLGFEMRKILDLSVLLFFALAPSCLTAQTVPEIRPWADPRLPIKKGLAVWLDATTLAAAAKTEIGTVPSPGQQIQRLHDGSGHRRDFIQPSEKARPTWTRVGDGWTIRFDGEDDHLRSVHTSVPANGLTVVLVAAPHQNPVISVACFPPMHLDAETMSRVLTSILGQDRRPSWTRSTWRVEASVAQTI